jgi:NAD(P)-dependent dehydrogenase (short-subunit alcohol dehydrogenase family)
MTREDCARTQGRIPSQGKTVVITGGTSGIGEIAAERLAQMGARIVLIARSKSRGKMTLARLHGKAPDLAHTVHYADLMKRLAAEIASRSRASSTQLRPRIWERGSISTICNWPKVLDP